MKRRREAHQHPQRDNPGVPGKTYREEKDVFIFPTVCQHRAVGLKNLLLLALNRCREQFCQLQDHGRGNE